jgi:uncharacterized membrane-anchored protein
LERGWQPADVRERREQEVVYDVEDHAGGFVRFDNGAVANLQKSGEEGGVIAKMGGVKLQKSAGIFAIMSTTLHAFGKVSEIGVARVSGNFLSRVTLTLSRPFPSYTT